MYDSQAGSQHEPCGPRWLNLTIAHPALAQIKHEVRTLGLPPRRAFPILKDQQTSRYVLHSVGDTHCLTLPRPDLSFHEQDDDNHASTAKTGNSVRGDWTRPAYALFTSTRGGNA